MRTIKFRGLYSGTWVYGNLILGKIENKEFAQIENTEFEDYQNWAVDTETVGQFTGLLDKNGKEIYESDVVRVDDDWDKYGMTAGESYEVYFNEGGFRLKPKYDKNARGYWLEDNNEFEIIGNIYENPELIEGATK